MHDQRHCISKQSTGLCSKQAVLVLVHPAKMQQQVMLLLPLPLLLLQASAARRPQMTRCLSLASAQAALSTYGGSTTACQQAIAAHAGSWSSSATLHGGRLLTGADGQSLRSLSRR
jgi:hypothetical protein